MKTWLWIVLVLLLALPMTAAADQGSCVLCHAPMPGHLGEPVELWKNSIHQLNGISCHGCHGGDPTLMSMDAMSLEAGFLGVPDSLAVPGFCGRCHVGVEENYRASAHGEALGSGGPDCVTCHGSHAVEVATLALINPQDCSRCHDYGRAGELRSAMEQTESMMASVDRDLNRLRRIGIATDELQGRLFSLRNDFRRLTHSVDVEKVQQRTQEFQSGLDAMRADIATIDESLFRRKLAGAGVTVLLLAACGIFALLRQSYHQQERKS